MKIKTYNDMEIQPIQNTQSPGHVVVATALAITQKKLDSCVPLIDKKLSSTMCKFLIQADHLSVVEHCSMTVFIKNVSRSFLAQLTRHRLASYTVSSQHYQDYRDYPVVIHPSCEHNLSFTDALRSAVKSYISAVDNGIPNYEARQLLPNASACNILMTINARSLVNLFQQRLCNRNTFEIQRFAVLLLYMAKTWWPEFFQWIGPYCAMHGKCNQGRMSCGKPWKRMMKYQLK